MTKLCAFRDDRRGWGISADLRRAWCTNPPSYTMRLYCLSPSSSLSKRASIAAAAPSQKGGSGTQRHIRWVDRHNTVPEPIAFGLNLTGTTFNGTLPPTLFCGELDVPLDYVKEFNAATNKITIGFAINRPKRSSGLILYGLQSCRGQHSRYPILEPPELYLFNDIPLAFTIGTNEVIQDWDSLRAALGYEKRVERFVLDAVIPHGMPFQEMVTDRIAVANRLVLRADTFCLNDPTCPFHGQGNGSVVKAWDTLLTRAIAAPLPAPSCGPTSATGCLAPVTATDLRYGLTILLASNPDFPLFNNALNASLNGDASLFGLKTFAAYNNISVISQGVDPRHILYSQMRQFFLMCSAWPNTVPA
ncbi:hypothetical protein B0H16DRAFT_1467721 [Mycena metata]|uniref:Uncharacterized protein n=1 Tax=Mycena metata TaxID=1033252 RepID=A0AAD7I3B3_9AGAR|nr:hypothetical protein B0H16DRAFT_1467721 [Mycena metata]